MDAAEFTDHIKELHALRNKMLAFPEERWDRERLRIAELEKLIAETPRRAVSA
jgi:hypothetical protein